MFAFVCLSGDNGGYLQVSMDLQAEPDGLIRRSLLQGDSVFKANQGPLKQRSDHRPNDREKWGPRGYGTPPLSC